MSSRINDLTTMPCDYQQGYPQKLCITCTLNGRLVFDRD